jgi:hypothetical protein
MTTTPSTADELPDVGAFRAAEYLAGKFGRPVAPDAIRELAARGLVPVVGMFRGYDLYYGEALAAFTNSDALADAQDTGALLTRDVAAAQLGIRRVDLDHLIRAGLLTPTRWGTCAWRTDVPLYRAGDLDELAASDRVDWSTVRAAVKGTRSPLADLPTKEASP